VFIQACSRDYVSVAYCWPDYLPQVIRLCNSAVRVMALPSNSPTGTRPMQSARLLVAKLRLCGDDLIVPRRWTDTLVRTAAIRFNISPTWRMIPGVPRPLVWRLKSQGSIVTTYIAGYKERERERQPNRRRAMTGYYRHAACAALGG